MNNLYKLSIVNFLKMTHEVMIPDHSGFTIDDFTGDVIALRSGKKYGFHSNLSKYIRKDAEKDSSKFPVMGKKLYKISDLVMEIANLYNKLKIDGNDKLENYCYHFADFKPYEELGHTRYETQRDFFLLSAEAEKDEMYYLGVKPEHRDLIVRLFKVSRIFRDICELPGYQKAMSPKN